MERPRRRLLARGRGTELGASGRRRPAATRSAQHEIQLDAVSIKIPNFGDFADADTVARVASAAQAAGWDALFVWDHVVHGKRYRRSFGDPLMLLTAAALATTLTTKFGT